MNAKKIMIAIMLVSSMTIGLIGCSTNNDIVDNSKNNNTVNTDKNTNEVTDDNDNNTTTPQEEPISSKNKDIVYLENNITKKAKNYIFNGQENKPESEKIKWSETFLNEVDIESLYTQYIDNEGNADNLESFASYITINAPTPNNWEDLFEKDLFDAYGEKVVRLEPLMADLYQAYVIKDGSEVPYVVVSSRTGYFHG